VLTERKERYVNNFEQLFKKLGKAQLDSGTEDTGGSNVPIFRSGFLVVRY
jgi:hypothetical protein